MCLGSTKLWISSCGMATWTLTSCLQIGSPRKQGISRKRMQRIFSFGGFLIWCRIFRTILRTVQRHGPMFCTPGYNPPTPVTRQKFGHPTRAWSCNRWETIQLRQAADGLTLGRKIKLRTKTLPHHYGLEEKLVAVSFKRDGLACSHFQSTFGVSWCLIGSPLHVVDQSHRNSYRVEASRSHIGTTHGALNMAHPSPNPWFWALSLEVKGHKNKSRLGLLI